MEEITMKKLRAGIVGCGGIANAKHLPAMEKCGLYEVVAGTGDKRKVRQQ